MKYRGIALVALLLSTVLLLMPALSGGFIFDDYPIFAENPAIHIAGWHWQDWQQVWAWSHDNIQRPLTMLSFALNYAFGSGIWGFKASNLGLHLVNVVLVWMLVRKLLRAAWKLQDNESGALADYWAMGVSAAWAIHPLQISAVMYVVQRMELLGFSFVLLALLAYWKARQQQIAGRRGWPWLLVCAALVLIGYEAKETTALVPGYALLLELTLLRFAAATPSTSLRWKLVNASGCVAAVLLLIFYLLPHYAIPAAYAGRDFDAWQRELTQLRALSMYLGWSILPLPNQLYFYYDNYPASTGLLHPATTLLGGLFLLGLLVVAAVMRRRRPLLTLGIGWFFVAHALTSSPIALELVFEHRNYPALLGPLLAVTDLLWLLRARANPRLPALLACVLLINLGFMTVLRAATWGNPLLLATTLAKTNPGSSRAALDLARRYVAMAQDNPQSPLYRLGIQELERASRLPGSSILPEEALLIQAANHPVQDNQAHWASLQEKLRTQVMVSDTYAALFGLQQLSLKGSQAIDAKQLAGAYEIAIARNPSRISLHVQYADLASVALNDQALAVKQWLEAVQLQKAPIPYAIELANYLVDNQRGQEALAIIARVDSGSATPAEKAQLDELRIKAGRVTAPATGHVSAS